MKNNNKSNIILCRILRPSPFFFLRCGFLAQILLHNNYFSCFGNRFRGYTENYIKNTVIWVVQLYLLVPTIEPLCTCVMWCQENSVIMKLFHNYRIFIEIKKSIENWFLGRSGVGNLWESLPHLSLSFFFF